MTFIMNVMKSTDLDTWLNIMKYKGIKGDEIALHALARVYQYHLVVYTKSKTLDHSKIHKQDDRGEVTRGM